MSFTSRELSKADESQMLAGLWNGIGRRGRQVRNEIVCVFMERRDQTMKRKS